MESVVKATGKRVALPQINWPRVLLAVCRRIERAAEAPTLNALVLLNCQVGDEGADLGDGGS